jgi:hypothetical protein
VDVAAEWVVVETVELAAAWVVLTCAVTTAARPRLRMAKNFILAKCVKKGLINERERYYSSCEKSVESASKCINNENRRGREGRRAQAALQTYKSRCVSQYLQGKS